MGKESNKKIKELLKELEETQKDIKTVENTIFRLESAYLWNTNETPITKTLDYYLNNKMEKRKVCIKYKERVFSKDCPH